MYIVYICVYMYPGFIELTEREVKEHVDIEIIVQYTMSPSERYH